MALATAGAMVGGMAAVANAGGYPLKCDNGQVWVAQYGGGYTGPYSTIQEGVDVAKGDDTGSSVGDTVIVCHGEFHENVVIPLTDGNGSNTNITLRSYDGSDQTEVVAANPDQPVITVQANGVVLGGPGLGLYLTGSNTGIQVGAPLEPDMSETDDQLLTDCLGSDPETLECTDKESPAATPINVSVIGNRIRDLTGSGEAVAGIAVNNSNSTLVYRNLVERLSVDNGIVYGIRYDDTNANNQVLQNAVHKLTQTGGDCSTSSLGTPSLGAIGVAIEDEALDALVHDTLIDDVTATCTAAGVFSSAWGGLENDRNGQQIPIATDVVGNRVKDITGADGQEAAVVLAPAPRENTNDEESVNPPSSFRVLVNDLQDSAVGVAVLSQLAPYSYIEENDFDHNSVGVLNTGDANLDATNNWWGCQEGPASGKKECATIVGAVFYNPWLKSHVDHAGAHAGEYAGHG